MKKYADILSNENAQGMTEYILLTTFVILWFVIFQGLAMPALRNYFDRIVFPVVQMLP